MNAFSAPMVAFLLFVSAAATTGVAAPATAEGESMRRLAADRGCTICHDEQPVSGTTSVIPPAPSWREIAARYRGSADAEDRLVRVVIGGSDPRERHWKNRAGFAKMLPNEVETTPDEARALVRWILSLPR